MTTQDDQYQKVLVVYPDAAEAIAKRRKELGLPEIPIEKLKYGEDEVTEIVNKLHASVIRGPRANLYDLLHKLEEGWDVIWLVTHGEEAGWYLSDGLVNVSEMTTMIRSSGIYLTVMNSCASYRVAKKAAEELGTAFICTLTEVPDRQAFITGVIFAQKLAAGYDYQQAFELAKPGQEHPYIKIEARSEMQQRPNSQGSQGNTKNVDSDTLQRFIKSVEDLDAIVNGNLKLGLPALKDVVKTLGDDSREVKNRLDSIQLQLTGIQERQKVRNIIMWGMVAIIVILLLTVYYLGVRGPGIL